MASKDEKNVDSKIASTDSRSSESKMANKETKSSDTKIPNADTKSLDSRRSDKAVDSRRGSLSRAKFDSRQEFSGISLELCSSSASVVCRICQDSKNTSEPLISPCLCSGTMGYMHTKCLETWLSHSQSNACEVCKFQFKTVRISKPFMDWIREGSRPQDQRYFYIDCLCFLLLTPLGCISCWLCIQGAQDYYQSAQPWTGFGLIMLSTFLFLMYFFWALITFRYHISTFQRWRSKNQIVRIQFENQNQVTSATV